MKRWLVLSILAVLGSVLLFLLFPHRESAALFGLRAGPDEMISRARELTRFHGLDTSSWPAACRSVIPARRIHYARVFDGPPHPLVTVAQAEVVLSDPRGGRSVFVTLRADGQPSSYEIRRLPGGSLTANGPPARAANEALAHYSGGFARSFEIENEGIRQGSDTVYSWNWRAPSPSAISVRFETVFENGALRSARLLPSYPGPFLDRIQRDQDQTAWLATAMIIAIGATFFLAFPAFFRGFVRRRFAVRRLPRLLLLSAGSVILASIAGRQWINVVFAAQEDLAGLGTRLPGLFIILSLLSLTPVLFYGAGRSLATPAELLRWRAFELLLDARLWTRPVGEGLASGVLAGLALSVLPLVASLPFPWAVVNLTEDRVLYSLLPWATPFLGLWLMDTAALYLFLWIYFSTLRLRWLGQGLFAAFGVAGLAVLRGAFDYWLLPSLVSGLLLLLAFTAVYRLFGLLAVLVSGMVVPAVYLAHSLAIQPSGVLQATAPQALALPLLVLAAGLVIARRGRPVDAAAEIAREQAELVEAGSDRDRLRAEFNVARKAQLGMLPDLPPEIEGLGLAGSCHPAREVGGDLYDFFPCADGRYGFCVADVSGKGVPASLYMAMTKGLIAAATHDSSDPGQILAWLNRHWVDHGKRRMFATMAMCLYDPRARSLEYVRAGHNPIAVWSNGEGRFVGPGGVGLGLASPRQFERTLRRETLLLSPGDLVVLYSDGIVEAMNLDSEQFGEERLMEAIRDCAAYSAAEAEAEISRRVRLFMGAAPPHDDMTLLLLKAL